MRSMARAACVVFGPILVAGCAFPDGERVISRTDNEIVVSVAGGTAEEAAAIARSHCATTRRKAVLAAIGTERIKYVCEIYY